jgi:hypothetical protein
MPVSSPCSRTRRSMRVSIPRNNISAQINCIAQRAGGPDKLKGMKIVELYHDSSCALPILELLQEKYGFELIKIPVAHPGVDQQAQWQQIRGSGAEWVLARSWGVMIAVAVKTAVKVGLPADHVISDIWSASESDTVTDEPCWQRVFGSHYLSLRN